MLNATSVPFRLKVLSDPNAYTRADAGVLYLHGATPWWRAMRSPGSMKPLPPGSTGDTASDLQAR